MFVTFRGGGAVVEQSKIRHASSPEAARQVRAALRRRWVKEEPAIVKDGAIIEGRIVKLKRGTIEFDRVALASLPDAFVMD